MNALLSLLERPRLTLSLALILSGIGLAAWFSMPREEDPHLAERNGLVIAPYPGANAPVVERMVVEPIEDALSEVEEIEHVDTIIRSGIAVLKIQLRSDVSASDTDRAWDLVDDALQEARANMPSAALEPRLDHGLMDTESVLIALTGVSDLVELAEYADTLEASLLSVPEVSRVIVSGDPGERITVDFDDVSARRLGLDPLSLASALQTRNVTIPGGSLRLSGRQVPIQPEGELETVEEIADLPIPLRNGRAVRLGDVAQVARTVNEPTNQRVRYQGQPAVVVGAVPRRGLRAEDFGAAVQTKVRAFATAHPEIHVDLVAFQPDRVQQRLGELGGSLLLGVAIVAAIVLLFMGLRMGLVVASVVPLVTFAGLAVYAATGGVLHQMAVAALVLALGLLVDNAIVVAETIQRRIDEGATSKEAARQAVRELTFPLAAATGTTLASFVPMLLAEGTVGDFTRAIPVVTILTLTVSYGYALFVTPILARLTLRPRKNGAVSRIDRIGERIGSYGARRPAMTLMVAVSVVALCGAFATQVRFNFFPSSDRDQLVVEIELPEGAHLDATDAASRRLEVALAAHPEVTSVTAFVGRSVPTFYYNLPRRPSSPHLAQLIVSTRDASSVGKIIHYVEATDDLIDAQIIARRLEQGPPVLAPIEVRLRGPDLSGLQLAADEVRRVMRATQGTKHVRANHGPGVATLRFAIDDAAAGRHGVDRRGVALALLGHSRGIAAGTYRGERDPMPIVVRAATSAFGDRGEALSPEALNAADVARPGAPPLPLLQIANSHVQWEPAVIHRRDRQRSVSVLSEHDDDVTYESIVAALVPRLDALDLPTDVEWEMGGAVAESAKANAALGAKGPLAALLLIGILLAQFNSFRRVIIVLATAPLAALGIWPGLFFADLPFGFVALLGAIALIGIAVNGAIVLLDMADRRRAEGASIEDALTEAVRVRTRPILLTTATTVAGLIPLLFSASTLWPPMAAAMISGLLVATLLTLGVVPALYRLLFRDAPARKLATVGAVAIALLSLGMAPATSHAQFDLDAAIQSGGQALTVDDVTRRTLTVAPEIAGADARVRQAQAGVRAARVSLLPLLTVGARYTRISNIDNDPLVSQSSDSTAETARLLEGVDDPETRQLLGGFLQALSDNRIEVPRNQFALTAGVVYPVSNVLASVLPRYRGARHGVRALRAQRTATQHNLQLRASEAFYALLRARSLRALAEHSRTRAEDQLNRVDAAVRAGAAPALDRQRMAGQVAMTAIAESRANAGVAISEEALRALLDLEGPLSPVADLNRPPQPPAESLVELVAQGHAQRSEAHALRALVRGQRSNAQGARADRYPSLILAANAQLANPNTNYVPLPERFEGSWDVSVLLRWSPSDIGRGNARAESSLAIADAARADLMALEDGIRMEVTAAFHTLRASSQAHELADVGLQAAQATYVATQRRWQEGSGALGAVVDADAELTAAGVRRIEAALDAYVADARLTHATGG